MNSTWSLSGRQLMPVIAFFVHSSDRQRTGVLSLGPDSTSSSTSGLYKSPAPSPLRTRIAIRPLLESDASFQASASRSEGFGGEDGASEDGMSRCCAVAKSIAFQRSGLSASKEA